MTSGGADALKAAIRRSLPVIVGLIVLGVVAVNLFELLAGAKYHASAKVEISATPLSAIITNTTSPLIDPGEVQATAQTLGGAVQVYRLAALRTGYRYGTASDLSNATSVSSVGATDLLSFAATAGSGADAVAISNAVANAYTTYRAGLIGSGIQQQIASLQATAATETRAEQAQIRSKIFQLQLAKASASAGAVLVEPAVSAVKTSPRLGKDSAIGFAVGLVIALLLVAVREAIDTTVRTEGDVEELLAAPVLASLRSLPRRTQIVTVGRYEPLYGGAYALLAAQLAPDKRETEHTVLALTSAVADEGKTTTVANLAVSLARRGENVLLADLDFHRPTLAGLFEIPHDATGALQILDGERTLEESLWEVSLDGPLAVAKSRADPDLGEEHRARAGAESDAATNGRRPGAGTLLILPSGKTGAEEARDPYAALGPLLSELRTHAGVVILDAPPALLTVEMTELAQLIDIVVVVVRQGHVSQRALRSLGRHARAWPSELTGAVLTDVPTSTTHGGH